ncbi:hypothetical protein CAL7716_013680 [Calothrix sp. PCC 7716]|nr:hypothetical protein CAL7716_013680 [Calothrix sp. PCC 7716]
MSMLNLAAYSLLAFAAPEINHVQNNSSSNTDIFAAHIVKIKQNLPSGLRMRLPSGTLLSKNTKNYTVEVFSTSQSRSTVYVYDCEQQQYSCLIGSFSAANTSSDEALQEFKQFQNIAKPIAIANNLQGYLLKGQGQNGLPDSQLIWQQDNQFYKVTLLDESNDLLKIVNSMVDAAPIVNNQLAIIPSRRPVLTTAEQLRGGEILTTIRNRSFIQTGNAAKDGLTDQPTIGVSWGVNDNLELTLDVQTIDNSGPVRQGKFSVQRINSQSTTNFFQETTLQAKQRIWQSQNGTQALSGVVALSRAGGGRPYRFSDNAGLSVAGLNKQTVFSLELPYTFTPNDQWQFTLSPKVAFLPEDNALYLNKLPGSNSGFGTTFGLASGISYKLSNRFIIWGDAFVPFSGNNTINRDTGLVTKTIAYNAGLRYVINPRLSTDLFVSNALGNTGALSLIADREYTAIGLGVNYLPGITNANRSYPERFGATQQPAPSSYAGFGFLDGGTVRKNQLLTTFQAGGQGLLPNIRYGLLDDLEIGAFLSSIPGTVDESQFGFSTKVRLMHQESGNPFTLSLAGTIARSNNVLTNFVNNNRNRFQQLGLKKGGFAFRNEREGELFVYSISAPMHYQFQGGSAVWLTPTLGFIQRDGWEIAGLNFGGSLPLSKDLNAIAEVGVNLKNNGNAFIGNQRESVIPWTVGLRWNPSSLLGNIINGLELEAYFTNRLGSNPFDSLRVRADNETTFGVGVLLPIQF